MVNKEVVLATVKKMVNSGIDGDTIRQTLKGIGQTDSEIDEVLATAHGEPANERLPDQPTGHPVVAQRIDEAREEQALRDEQLHSRLDEHNEKLGELHSEIKKISSGARQAPPEAKASIPLSIEKDVIELKASSKAVQDLLKKILETNRQILFKLEQKK